MSILALMLYRALGTCASFPIPPPTAAAPSTPLSLISAVGSLFVADTPEKAATADEAAGVDLASFCCTSLTPSTKNGPRACGGGRERGPADAVSPEERSLGSTRTRRP